MRNEAWSRILPFTGIHNFRDYPGFLTPGWIDAFSGLMAGVLPYERLICFPDS
jgi:hypothetical protein